MMQINGYCKFPVRATLVGMFGVYEMLKMMSANVPKIFNLLSQRLKETHLGRFNLRILSLFLKKLLIVVARSEKGFQSCRSESNKIQF